MRLWAARVIRSCWVRGAVAHAIGCTTTATYRLLPRLRARLRGGDGRIAVTLEELASPAQPDALADGLIDLGPACLPVVAARTSAAPWSTSGSRSPP